MIELEEIYTGPCGLCINNVTDEEPIERDIDTVYFCQIDGEERNTVKDCECYVHGYRPFYSLN